TFAESILGRVLGADGEAPLPATEVAAALRALAQAEFLYEQALYPEAEYAFKHPLTQEVAYGAQLAARRARVHAAVARALEDLGEASGDAHTLAFVVHAAGWCRLFSGAPMDAAPLFEEAMARQDERTDLGLRIWTQTGVASASLHLGHLTEALTRSDEAIALGRGDPHAGLDLVGFRPYLNALFGRGWILRLLGRLAEAAQALDQTIALAEQHGDWVPGS